MRIRHVTVALVISITMFGTSPPAASAAIAPCTGRCFDVAIPLPAGVNVTSNVVRILLPTGYSSTSTRYPVIYLLCGAGGNQTEWTTSSDLINFTSAMQAIFVMPDCGGAAGHPGWDSDWANGQYQWETFYISVLMPWIDASYRTIKGDNGIAGLSMGGYGALALAARHPALFRAVGDFSGLPDIQYPGVSLVNLGVVPQTIWGSETTNAANWTAHNPTALVTNLKGISLYLSCGTGDPTLYNGPEETLSAEDHVPFVQALQSAGIPFHAGFFSGGAHTWPYFSLEAAWALPQMLANLQS
jgi:diacylglycerol O-acyltransferase / trehalose O-mycolyltransferase / mycolyltransferase Ag85